MMSKLWIFTFSVLGLCAAALAEEAADAVWHRQTRSAFEAAEREGLPVLMLLRVEAHRDKDLSGQLSAAFAALEGAPVATELVYPEEAYGQVAVAQEFIGWADRVGATTLPAVAWLDASGRPYGLTHVDPAADPEVLERRLVEMSQRYRSSLAAFAEARGLTDSARAQRLHDGLQLIDTPCRASYYGVMRQIVALDPKDALGLKSQYEPILTEVVINEIIQGEVYPLVDSGEYARAFSVLGRLMRQHATSVEQRQLLLAFQAQLLHSQSRTEEALAMLDKAIALAPESAVREKLVASRAQFVLP